MQCIVLEGTQYFTVNEHPVFKMRIHGYRNLWGYTDIETYGDWGSVY